MKRLVYLNLVMALSMSVTAMSYAEADGPEFWTLNQPTPLYAQPALNAFVLAKLPAGPTKFLNNGCVGVLNVDLWSQLTPAQQKVAEANVWCKIEFQQKTGWIPMKRLQGAN